MSDRILFSTQYYLGDTRTNPNTDTVDLDYPDTAGYSGFPFRPRMLSVIQAYYPGDARHIPIPGELTFQQAIEIYWRVRKWQITLTGTARRGIATPPFFEDADFEFSVEVEVGTNYIFIPAEIDPDTEEIITPEVNEEEHLVFRERDLLNEFRTIFGEKKSDPGTDGNTIIIQAEFPAIAIGSYVVWDNTENEDYLPPAKFFPAFAIGTPVYGLPYPFANKKPYTNPYAAGNPRDYTPVGDVTLKLSDGVEIIAEDAVFENNDLTSNFSCDIEIEASEWWPYATSEGDPVWDTATGARITDPFS